MAATSLPPVDLVGKIDIEIFEGKNLVNAGGILRTSDPYVRVWAGDQRLAFTEIFENNLKSPQWNAKFAGVDINADDLPCIRFEVMDESFSKDATLGKLRIPARDLASGQEISGWFKLAEDTSEALQGDGSQGELRISLKYTSVTNLPSGQEVPETYFPIRSNCKVTLYQDAHQPAGRLPSVRLANGQGYVNASCWDDMYAAFKNAKHFIYACGWSIWPLLRMKRDEHSQSETLGDLLKAKADEGVRVLLLAWDEKTSNAFNRNGLMATHDEECINFFQDSKVHFRKVARQSDPTEKLMSVVGILFTHHQKTVILDAESPFPNKRRILSFVGGLDLTDGRYDTADHHLFRTLGSVHKEDFHQSSISVVSGQEITSANGPREPWHDIHGRFEGPIARDVMTNFEERWRFQVNNDANLLVNLSGDSTFISEDQEQQVFSGQHLRESWNCQLFRSIDARSAEFTRSTKHLGNKKGRFVEASIHKAYIHHIRRAKRYIYIENQYFLGSSHMWQEPMRGADHLIPAELINKICSKIKNHERFTAYIVVPLFPEGDPASTAVGQILHWQYRTVSMMYNKIAEALREAHLNHHPTEYLMFFFLANRETEEGSQADPAAIKDGLPRKFADTRRFMIYVHSKMMIVDDDFIVLGSANINQRSMIGTRDSEIAVGSWQNGYQCDGRSTPRGQIHGFRMSLFAEHLGAAEEVFRDPSSIECVHRVHEIARKNWEQYESDTVTEMHSHLTLYPYEITEDGRVNALKSSTNILDTDAAVIPPKPGFLMSQLATLTM